MDLHAHSDRVFSIESLLGADECSGLIADAERHGFADASVRTAAGQKMMQNIRNNQRAQFESPVWIHLLWQRLSAAYEGSAVTEGVKYVLRSDVLYGEPLP